jgi:hypothetical protein
MLEASLRGEKSASGLHELNKVLAHGEPVSVEVIGFNLISNETPTGPVRTTNLSYQIHFRDSWAAGDVSVGHPSGPLTILSWQFQPISDSLERLNRFTFAGKSLVHYLVFAACIAVPAFILVALIVCIRSPIRRKWIWIIFILLGLVAFRFDWASGHFDVQPISFLLFGASAFRVGYAPWILSFAIPVGAIIFLLLRPGFFRDLATIFLALIVLGALGIKFIAAPDNALDKESKAYADAAIPAIVTSWIDQSLLDRASPEFNQTITAAQVYYQFRWWESNLGRLQKCEPAQGQSLMSVTRPSGEAIRAKYATKAQFEKGEATVGLVLIKHGGQWQIVSFDVNSQLLPSKTTLDKESKAYADAAIPAMVTTWNKKELLNRASSEFNQAITTDQVDRLFKEASSLGRLRKCEPAQGESELVFTSLSGSAVGARYTSNADFEKGPATIVLTLIKHGDQWQIAGFWVTAHRRPK